MVEGLRVDNREESIDSTNRSTSDIPSAFVIGYMSRVFQGQPPGVPDPLCQDQRSRSVGAQPRPSVGAPLYSRAVIEAPAVAALNRETQREQRPPRTASGGLRHVLGDRWSLRADVLRPRFDLLTGSGCATLGFIDQAFGFGAVVVAMHSRRRVTCDFGRAVLAPHVPVHVHKAQQLTGFPSPSVRVSSLELQAPGARPPGSAACAAGVLISGKRSGPSANPNSPGACGAGRRALPRRRILTPPRLYTWRRCRQGSS